MNFSHSVMVFTTFIPGNRTYSYNDQDATDDIPIVQPSVGTRHENPGTTTPSNTQGIATRRSPRTLTSAEIP